MYIIMLTERDLELRRRSIGSSDIGVLAGHSLYRNATPLSIWESKVFGSHGGSSDAMRAGNYFERGIAEWYLDNLGLREEYRARKMPRRVHPQRRWMSATCDYRIERRERKPGDPLRMLECKLVGPGMERHYDLEDPLGVPAMVEDQVRWQMATAEYDCIDVAAYLSAPRKLAIWRFERDRDHEKELIEIGEEFWFTFVVPCVPPPLDYSEAAARQLARMYPTHGEELIQASASAEEWARKYDDARQAEKEAKAEKDAARLELCKEIGEAAGIQSYWGKATWKSEKAGRVDEKSLLRHLLSSYPDDAQARLREQFRKPPIRVFRLATK